MSQLLPSITLIIDRALKGSFVYLVQISLYIHMPMHVCTCACVCVCACERVCVRACVKQWETAAEQYITIIIKCVKHQLHIISKKVNLTFMWVQGYTKARQKGERKGEGGEGCRGLCVCVCHCVCVHLHVHVCACEREGDRESYAVRIRWFTFPMFHVQGFEPHTIVEGSSIWETHWLLFDQMVEHILQRCPLLQTARRSVWLTAVHLHTKLYGSKEELEKTATVTLQTRLSV